VEDGEQLTVTRQSGQDEAPCYYDSSYPAKERQAYEKSWHAKNDPKPGATRAIDGSDSYIVPPNYHDLNDHLWRFFQSVKTRQPSVEDAVFGNNTSIACHMANHSYFHESAARWDTTHRRITV
jgi:hypothetical protein